MILEQNKTQYVHLSSLDEQKVHQIVDDLCNYLGAKNIPDLAKKLDVTPNAIYRWIERGSIPGKKLNKKFPELNINYLETGKGNLILNPSKGDSELQNPELNKVREQLDEYQSKAAGISSRPLPKDNPVQLLEVAMQLIGVAIEELQAQQRSRERRSPDDTNHSDNP